MKEETRYPKALGRYVDLRVIQELEPGRASSRIADLYGAEAAQWCRKVCQEGTHRDEE